MNNSEPINDEMLSAYLDGELSEAEALRVEQQIEQDDALRGSLSELEKIRDEIRQLPRHKLPSDFATKVTQSIEQQQSAKPQPTTQPTTQPTIQPTIQKATTPPRRLAGALAAIAALLFISIWGIRYLPQSQNTAMSDVSVQLPEGKAGGLQMKQAPREIAAAAAQNEVPLHDSSPAMEADTIAAAAKANTLRRDLPQARGRTDLYDLVVDYELDAKNIDLVSTSLDAWEKRQTPDDAIFTEYVIEGTPEEIRTALVALRSAPTEQLARTQVGQDYQNRFMAIDKNRFAEKIGLERLAEANGLGNGRWLAENEGVQVPSSSVPDDSEFGNSMTENPVPQISQSKADLSKAARTPTRALARQEEYDDQQAFSAQLAVADETESADKDETDTIEAEDTAPVRMRVLVRVRNK